MLTSKQFEYVARLVRDVAGIRLGPGKEGLVQSRLNKRINALGLSGIEEYIDLVKRGGTAELSNMVDVLTTNKTSFFREPAHFDYLREHMIPEWERSGRPVRIWSAGCSSGEEPYTVSMVVHEAGGGLSDRTRVLATDLSTPMLARARTGSYPAAAVADVPPDLLRRYFRRDARGGWTAGDRVREPIRFARLNLMHDWPMRGPFDLILCRNVMIYFDAATQERLVDRFAAMLRPGAHLFVGHSESLSGLNHGFTYVQPATYVR